MKRLKVLVLLVFTAAVCCSFPSMSSAAAPSNNQTLRISTIPTAPGMTILVDGKPYVTQADGTATAAMSGVDDFLRVGNLTARITAESMDTVRDGVPVRISPSGIRKMNGAVLITVDIAWRVQFTYSKTGAGEIDQGKLGLVTIKSSTGEVEQVDPHEPLWLQGSRVVPRVGGMEDKKLYWTVQEVLYEGANVVNASQQQVFPADTQNFEIQLLFYSARIRVHDAFFGWTTGDAVALTYPDKHIVEYPLGDDGELVLNSLPRGAYAVTILGPGPKMNRPLAISRDQELDLEFYSWFDIGVVLLALGGFVAATLFIGRRRRRQYATSHGGTTAAEAVSRNGGGGPQWRERHRHRRPRGAHSAGVGRGSASRSDSAGSVEAAPIVRSGAAREGAE